MRKRLTMTGFLCLAPLGAAFADDACFAPMADWYPRDVLIAMAQEQGWSIRRIKIDDGCYEIIGEDGNRRKIEVKIHPATLQVLELEYEDRDDDNDDDDRDGRHGRDDD